MGQLECRVVITYRDKQASIGMYDPLNNRYEALGTHSMKDFDKVVNDLKASIERAGHRLTFCERRER